MKRYVFVVAMIALSSPVAGGVVAQQKPDKHLSTEAARGKYLTQIAGCNDCHTPGYAISGGKVEEKLWLTGDQLGWRGPWGTTYPPNLRLLVQNLTAEQFMERARRQVRPPMPWFNLRVMSDRDVKAIYAYLKYLGPAGEPAPQYIAPDQKPGGPFVQFPVPSE
jgi:mono/diheme cytochrome c family protein